MANWNTGWEIEFPATTADEILLALVVRDLIHGASFDVEAEETGAEFAVDYTAGDELEDGAYRLLLMAEIEGPEDAALLQAFTEQALEELIEEGRGCVGGTRAGRRICRLVPAVRGRARGRGTLGPGGSRLARARWRRGALRIPQF